MNNDIKLNFKIPMYIFDEDEKKFIIFDWKEFEIKFFIINPKKKHLWNIAVDNIHTVNCINIYTKVSKETILRAISDVINNNSNRITFIYKYITTDDLTTYPESHIRFLDKTLFKLNKEMNRDKLTKFGLIAPMLNV